MLTIYRQSPLFLFEPSMSSWHHYNIIALLWPHLSTYDFTMTSLTPPWYHHQNTIKTPWYRSCNLTCSYLDHLVITSPWLSTQSCIRTSQALWLAVIASGQQTVHLLDLTFETGIVTSTRVLSKIDIRWPCLDSTSRAIDYHGRQVLFRRFAISNLVGAYKDLGKTRRTQGRVYHI